MIAVTGYSPNMHPDRVEMAGFDHYFTNPIDFNRLLALLESLAA